MMPSSDRSWEIVHQLSKTDPRIQIHKNNQTGIIPALQLGLQKSTGKYVTRMDADDIMPQKRLSLMIEKIEQSSKKTIVTGKVNYFGKQPISEGYLNYQKWLNERIENSDFFDHIYRECVVASPNWIARRKELIEDQLFDQLQYPEDYDLVFRWKMNNYIIVPINQVTLLWREHPERTSRNSSIYQQDAFFRLKLSWFLTMEKPTSLAILGVGTKGKKAAQFMIDRQIDFSWHDLKYNQYKSPIYNKKIEDYKTINASKLLIAVYPKEIDPLIQFITNKGYQIGKNAWFL